MDELRNKLVDLKVQEKVELINLDNADSEARALEVGEKLKTIRSEIEATEAEINKPAEEETEETTEETPDEEEKTEEPAKEETEEETDPQEEENPEEAEERGEWVKVEKRSLKETKILERGVNNMNKENIEAREARAKDLIEGRSVTIASDGVLLPTHQSNEVADLPFKAYSGLVDQLNVVNLQGGETYKKSFVKAYGTAGTTAESADYTLTEPTFDDVQVSKVKLTAYDEISEELEKLPLADYEARVREGINVALKKKIAQQVIAGAGTSNTFVGIYSTETANACVLTSNDLEVSSIGEDTLTDIVFNYGGDEEVEGVATLILSKKDLLAFAKVKDSDGKRAYKIDYANRLIDGIPYIINSNCNALSDANTAANAYTMVYGVLSHYEVPVFSPVEIMKSYDYKFKQGIICYKASVFIGGNTTSYKGFMRIKKAVASV